MKLADLLLLPQKIYQRLNDKKATLFLGIILVGILDLVFTYADNFSRWFAGQSGTALFYNITLAILLMLLTGFVDVLFFSLPLFDLFNRMSKDKEIDRRGRLIRVMKVSVLATVIVFPANLIVYLSTMKMDLSQILTYAYLYLAAAMLIAVWYCATAFRGLNVIYGFNARFRSLAFMTILTWSFMLQVVLTYMLEKWAIPLFR